MNGLWDVILAQQTDKKRFCCLSVTMFLQEDVEHRACIVNGSPKPVVDPTDHNVHFIQMPSRTPSGFAVAQFFGEEWSEFNVPLTQGFVADVNPSFVKEFLDISLAERESVVQPQRVPNDAQWKTVSIGLPVSHSLVAYQRLVARTQAAQSVISPLHAQLPEPNK